MKKWYWIPPVVVAADQLVKWLSIRLTENVTLIPGVMDFTYVENTGMAFSMLSGHTWLLGIASVVCILLGWWLLRRYRLGVWSRIGAMLMLGGAVGNMIDRLFRGYVVDMFETLFVNFAVFNVADAALTVGVIMMIISLLLCPEDWKEKQEDAKDGSQ